MLLPWGVRDVLAKACESHVAARHGPWGAVTLGFGHCRPQEGWGWRGRRHRCSPICENVIMTTLLPVCSGKLGQGRGDPSHFVQ